MNNQLSKEEKIQLNKILQNIFKKIINFDNKTNRLISNDKKLINNIYSDYHNLIIENIKKSNNITYILHILSKEIFFTELIQNKIKLFNLLPEFFSPFINNLYDNLNITLCYPYLSRILTVIQNNLSLNIQPNIISDIFSKIISIIFKTEYENKIKKEYFEIFQGFCYYNMKQNEYKNQIVGVLCLKELIVKTNYYIQNKKYIKNIYEKIILFIDNNNFEPKSILVELLEHFVNKCQQYYKPYINVTFYKLLNNLETDDINLKRKIIDVLGIIILMFPYEFRNIKDSMDNFLILLSKDKDEYIKYKSNKILYEFENIFNLNKKIENNVYNDNYYSTFSSFRSNIFGANKTKRNYSKNNIIKNDSLFSKSTRYSTSKKYIRDSNYYLLDSYKKDNNKYFNISNKNRKNSAKTLNINYYRDHYKMMKENYFDNNKFSQKTIDINQKSLIYNLNKLKKDITNMSHSLNNRVNQIENKIYQKI